MLFTAGTTTPAVYRLRSTSALDSDGDSVESWDTPERTLLRAAVVQPVSTKEEDGVIRRLVSDEYLLLVPGFPDLKATDRVEYEGDVWRIDGTPIRRRAQGSGSYTTAPLTRVATY